MKNKKAFTIVELIFVIIIIAILASAIIPRLMSTRDDSKIAACVSDISTLITDLTVYYTSQGNFSSNSREMTNVNVLGGYSTIIDNNGTQYIGQLDYICQDQNQHPAVSLLVYTQMNLGSSGYEHSISIEDGNSSHSLDKQLIEQMKNHNLVGHYKLSGLRYKY